MVDRQCKVCEMESQVTKEDIVIGKNGSHISVQCPGCNMPATLSYDFLGKVLGTDKEGAKAWVKEQYAAGRPNPVSKGKKGAPATTFPDQSSPSPDSDPVYPDYPDVSETITHGERRMNGDSCTVPNAAPTNGPVNIPNNNSTVNVGAPGSTFESIDVDRILEQTPMDVLKNSYRGFRLPADVVRDLDRFFDLHYPEGMISPTEAQAGFTQFPKIPKSIQPQLAVEYQRNLNTWEIERKKASALYDGINLRNTKPNVNPFYGPVGSSPGSPGAYTTPVFNAPPVYTMEQQNVLMQSQTDPNFQYRVQSDPRLAQIWWQIQQIQQQNAMIQHQMYQQPQNQGMSEESLMRILRQERERSRLEMQQMMQQMAPPKSQEKGTADVLLVLLTEMMKNNGAQQQTAQQTAQQLQHQHELEMLKNEINSLKNSSAKERDPVMEKVMTKMIDMSLGQGPNQMNAILNELDELKKKGNLSSNGIRSSDDFHNFIELQKVMAEISDKKSSFEERKENREMIKNLVTEGIGQVAGVVGAIITGKSGMPPAPSPGQSPALQQEVGAMVTEHTVTLPCMYCQKTITFPRGVETVECPFCHNVMGVPPELSEEDDFPPEEQESEGSIATAEVTILEPENHAEVTPELTPEVIPDHGESEGNSELVSVKETETPSDVDKPVKKTGRKKKAEINTKAEAPVL